MVVRTSFGTNDVTGNTVWNIVFKVTIESLMFTIFNFQICKVASAMLSCKRSFLHVNGILVFLLLLLLTDVVTTWLVGWIIIVLILEASIANVIWNFTHAFRINRHGFMGFLSHSEHFAHLRGSRGSWTFILCWLNSVFFSAFFKISMLQCLRGRHSVVVVVNEKFTNDIYSFRVLWHQLNETTSFFLWKVKLHVAGNFLKLIK